MVVTSPWCACVRQACSNLHRPLQMVRLWWSEVAHACTLCIQLTHHKTNSFWVLAWQATTAQYVIFWVGVSHVKIFRHAQNETLYFDVDIANWFCLSFLQYWSDQIHPNMKNHHLFVALLTCYSRFFTYRFVRLYKRNEKRKDKNGKTKQILRMHLIMW